MDFGRVFGYIFKDEDWIKKVLIGGLLNLVPFVGSFFSLGYFLSHYKNMREGRDIPLPEWEDIGGKFVLGFKAFVVYLVYILPVILLYVLSFFLAFLTINKGKGGAVLGLIVVLFYFIIFLYYIFLGLILPAVLMKFTENFNIPDAFKFGEILGIVKSNIKEFLILFVVMIASSFIMSLGMILCGVGVLFTMFIGVGIYLRAVAEVDRELRSSGKL